MNNILLRLKDIDMSRKTFARIATTKYKATPTDVRHLFRFGYIKRISDERGYDWVLDILEIGGDELVQYGLYKTNGQRP